MEVISFETKLRRASLAAGGTDRSPNALPDPRRKGPAPFGDRESFPSRAQSRIRACCDASLFDANAGPSNNRRRAIAIVP
jgi:hypothetical protein